MNCKHPIYGETNKEVLKADEVHVLCVPCQEIVAKRARVNSSNVFSVGIVENDLVVEFISGYPYNLKVSLYRYPDLAHKLVPMLKAHSAGEYFVDEVKAEVGRNYERIR